MRSLAALLALLLLSLASISCTMWKNPPQGWAGATGGEQLERQFWQEVAGQQWTSVRGHLAENFTLTTPEGLLGREQAPRYWQRLVPENYSLGNFNTKPNGSDVVVAYRMNTSAAAQAQGADPEYVILSVWQEVGTRWIMIAQSIHSAAGTAP